jgi:hypothetical protein
VLYQEATVSIVYKSTQAKPLNQPIKHPAISIQSALIQHSLTTHGNNEHFVIFQQIPVIILYTCLNDLIKKSILSCLISSR